MVTIPTIVTIVTIITIITIPTGNQLTSVTVHGVACTSAEYVTFHTTISCVLPSGVGTYVLYNVC